MYLSREEVERKVKEISKNVVEGMGLEIFDVKFAKGSRGWILTVYIDREDGYISIEDCEVVSRKLDPVLDEINIIEHSYTLEVSSPGMDRPLRSEKDYVRFKGNLAKFKLNEFISNKKVIVGHIQDYDSENKKVLVKDRDTGNIVEIPLESISKANLEVEF